MSLRGVVASITALLLSACASGSGGGVVLTHDQIGSSYYGSELGYAAGKGGMPTAVFGNPFAIDKAAFDRTVTDAMYRKNPGIAVRFSTEIDDPQRWLYRVVMYFDPPVAVSGQTACNPSATLRSVAQKEDRLVLLAALCRGNKSLSEIRGTTSRGSGPDDPSFRSLITQVVLNMFPTRNPDIDADCRQPILVCN
jgi:hypothetical protein